MLCLGIESSCDETSVALLQEDVLIDQIITSQASLHSIFGGVVPELASREHERHIGRLFDNLLNRNNLNPSDIDLIGVARGPGLLGSLLVGANFAKGLAFGLNKPIVGVNHLHAHALAIGLTHKLEYPSLALVVSGGHTQLYRVDSPVKFIQLGRTLDDAAGEIFDKIGHLLGLEYPAGASMDKLAQMGKVGQFPLPRPYLNNDNYDFSFSGLKTAAAKILKEYELLNIINKKELIAPEKYKLICNFCADFNLALAETISKKTKRILDKSFKEYKAVWLSGGVAANKKIRETILALAENFNMPAYAADLKFCGDNGAMIANAARLIYKEGYKHKCDFEIIPRGKIIPEDMVKIFQN